MNDLKQWVQQEKDKAREDQLLEKETSPKWLALAVAQTTLALVLRKIAEIEEKHADA